MLSHPLTNFETHVNYQKQPKFSGVYSRNNLLKIKDGADAINRGKYKLIRTHWIALYINANNVTLFNRFGGEHIPKEIEKLIDTKGITRNIKWFNNVCILLYWIYWFYAKR